MRNSTLILMLAASLAVLPTNAVAQSRRVFQPGGGTEPDVYLTGYYGRNLGGQLFKDRSSTNALGVAITFLGRGALSAEVDLGYSPYFIDEEDVGGENTVVTLTASAIAGPWLGGEDNRVRPYFAAGGGLIRSEIGLLGNLSENTTNRGVIDVGGGILYLAGSKIGVRGDVRYFQGVGAKGGQGGWGLLRHYNFMRATIGLALGF